MTSVQRIVQMDSPCVHNGTKGHSYRKRVRLMMQPSALLHQKCDHFSASIINCLHKRKAQWPEQMSVSVSAMTCQRQIQYEPNYFSPATYSGTNADVHGCVMNQFCGYIWQRWPLSLGPNERSPHRLRSISHDVVPLK